MIIKIMNRRAAQDVSDVRALLRYIRGGRPGDEDKVILGFGGACGFGLSGDADAKKQQQLLERLVQDNRASTHPLMHAMLSWDSGVEPSPAEVRGAVELWLRGIGAAGLPAVWEVHGNTAHVHAHVMLCRLDPANGGRARELGLFKKKTQRAKARIEALQGLQGNPQDIYVAVPDKGVQANPNARYWQDGAGAPDVMPPLAQGAAASEQRTGVESAQRRAQEEAWPRIVAAGSWEEIHVALAEVGCRLVPRKGGLSVLVQLGEKEVPVRASHVHRTCSRKALEARLGAYMPPAAPEAGEESKTATTAPRPVPEAGKAKPKPVKETLAAVPEMEPKPAPAVPLRRPAPGMDAELVPWWVRFQAEEEAEARTRRIWAEARASERRAVRDRVRAETRRASQLVREARRRGEHLIRGVMTAFRMALEDDARQRRKELSARQEAEAQAPSAGFAAWLERQGRPELAERWRRRGAVPVVAEGAGWRLKGTALAKTALRTVWRPGWSLPAAGEMLENATITASVPESKEPAGEPSMAPMQAPSKALDGDGVFERLRELAGRRLRGTSEPVQVPSVVAEPEPEEEPEEEEEELEPRQS